MSKVIRAAGVVRDIEFDSVPELCIYLAWLDQRGFVWKELNRFVRSDGSVVVRIVQQYNSCDLIEL